MRRHGAVGINRKQEVRSFVRGLCPTARLPLKVGNSRIPKIKMQHALVHIMLPQLASLTSTRHSGTPNVQLCFDCVLERRSGQ